MKKEFIGDLSYSPRERDAIKTVIAIGEEYGFGNLISHLKTAWAKSLVDKYQLPEKTAIDATNVPPYPLDWEW